MNLINPHRITLSESSNEYTILSINPTLISNDDLVTISYKSLSPSMNDWIGAYSPSDASIVDYLPAKYGFCYQGDGDYLTTGVGSLTFNFTNLRSDIKFYYFTNGLAEAVLVSNSSDVVDFEDYNEPLRNRIVATGNQNSYNLIWTSYNDSNPTLLYGTGSNNYIYTSYAITSTISKSSLCGSPANKEGWHDLGLIHTATINGIVDNKLYNSKIYYKFGDSRTNKWSKEFIFYTPPLLGSQPKDRPTTVVLLADLGVGSSLDSSNTYTWMQEGTPAINTTMSITPYAQSGLIDAIFHSGDISYANGHIKTWDFFLDMISSMAGSTVYLTTIGNHESDWPGSGTLDYGSSSGGECGVLSTTLLPMPSPASLNEPWWSYDIGIIHLVGISSEHDISKNSNQYKWLENDLRSVNRSLTPWIIVSGHRAMYVDSNEVGYTGSDVYVMNYLQSNIEDLLYKYQVNLYFAGHYHDTERQSAVYKGEVVQESTYIYNENNEEIAYHDNPNATVHMLIGAAGNGPEPANYFYSWSERNFSNLFGYAIVEAHNESFLYWKFINSRTNVIIDRMIIKQNVSSIWYLNSLNNNNHVEKSYFNLFSIILIPFVAVLIGYVGFLNYMKYYNNNGYMNISKNDNKIDVESNIPILTDNDSNNNYNVSSTDAYVIQHPNDSIVYGSFK